jgi:hypothetical protein
MNPASSTLNNRNDTLIAHHFCLNKMGKFCSFNNVTWSFAL